MAPWDKIKIEKPLLKLEPSEFITLAMPAQNPFTRKKRNRFDDVMTKYPDFDKKHTHVNSRIVKKLFRKWSPQNFRERVGQKRKSCLSPTT